MSSSNAATSANPLIAQMLDMIAPPATATIEPPPEPEAPLPVFARLSPFFDEAHRARHESRLREGPKLVG